MNRVECKLFGWVGERIGRHFPSPPPTAMSSCQLDSKRMRIQMFYMGAASVIHSVEQGLTALSIAARAAGIASRTVCMVPGEHCDDHPGFVLYPCHHTVCVRHVQWLTDKPTPCPVCGTFIAASSMLKLTQHRTMDVASLFGLSSCAEPPACLLRSVMEKTTSRLHRGLFIGFLAVVEARLGGPVKSFAPEALGALEHRSPQEHSESALAGFVMFFVVWRQQLLDGRALDAAAERVAEIAVEHGVFERWNRRGTPPCTADIAQFLVSFPVIVFSPELVGAVFNCTEQFLCKVVV